MSIKDSLAVKNPTLSKQWHPTKNGNLTPNDVTTGSSKKVWWRCEKGHEWEAKIANRTYLGRGCPFCSGRYSCDDNSLQVLNPELSKQWHPTKNGNLTPDDVTTGSNKKVWWQCEKGHEWEAIIVSRVSGNGCPYCSGQRVCDDNSLHALNPELVKQWHFYKNGDLTPNNVTVSSGKKVWWQCEKGHEWKAAISHRTNGTGCPICNQETNTSFPEQTINFYFKCIFNDTINRYKYNNKWEIDVFVPSLNLGIEYDGIYYHKNKGASDFKKEKLIINEGISLLIVKEVEKAIEKCYRKNNIIYCNKYPSEHQPNEVIKECFHYVSENITKKSYFLDVDVKRDRAKIYELFVKNEKDKSLFVINNELSKQWHPIKNLKIIPDMVKPNSIKKFWWRCEKGHEWEAAIYSRAKGSGCPYCFEH